MDELEDDNLMVVVIVTRNLLDKSTHAPEALATASLAALVYLLEGIHGGGWKPAHNDGLVPRVETLLPVLKAAYNAVPKQILGRGNMATRLSAFGAGDPEQALPIAAAAGIG
jgi:hypothetical protein